MVDAFTYTNGNGMQSFKSRAELYDHMISVGDVILEGEDAVKFRAHVEKRIKQGNNVKAEAALSRIEA